ncbi:flippase [Methanosarcina sp.]|uniref:flippase n=1 Tax=Methanosarcina sp. TaxID=2213 RepID=UPI002ABB5CE9|nr:flippase [Methanosarcina sp.]MDY9926313.1 flippase [Methanosarcina sp.]
MSTVKRVVKNSGFLLINSIATKIISFFILLYVARYLGPADYGKYSFAFAFIYFFSFIPDLGIHQILVREAAKDEKAMDKLIGNATVVKSFLSVLAFLLCCLTISITDYPLSTKNAVYAASLGLLAISLNGFGIVYEVKLRMDYSVIFSVTGRLFFLISILYLIQHNLDLNLFIIVTVVADFTHNILMTVFSRRFVKPKFKIEYGLVKKILLEALPIAVSTVFFMIYFRIDTVMLSFLTNDTDVGFYTAAYRLTEALTFIPSVLMVSIYPVMSKYFNEKNKAFNYIYTISFKLLFASGLLLATVITFLSENIILGIYGFEYYDSIAALQVLIWATSFMFVNQLLSSTYIASGNQNVMAKISAFAALLNIGLNLALIPLYSYTGASIATLITEFLVMVYGIHWIDKKIVHKNLYKEIISPLIGVCIISIFMLISRSYANIAPLSIISILMFTAILYNIGWVGSEDIALFKKILPKRDG